MLNQVCEGCGGNTKHLIVIDRDARLSLCSDCLKAVQNPNVKIVDVNKK